MRANPAINANFEHALRSGHLILTPNNRLLRRSLSLYKRECLQAGLQSWPAPRLYALNDWVRETWQLLSDAALLPEPRALINAQQELQLWLQIVADDSLLNPHALAQDAAAAMRSLLLWKLDGRVLDNFDDQFSRTRTWLETFRKQAGQRGLITLEQAQLQIVDCLRQGVLAPEQQLLALGFDDLPPLTRELFALTASHVVHASRPSGIEQAAARAARGVSMVECANEAAEIQAAAHWARQILSSEPGARIGIIVPQLGGKRQLLERVFSATFEPHYGLPGCARYTLPFNFSAGVPLGRTPLIRDALQLLRLNLSNWPGEHLIALLNSPFWGADRHAGLVAAISARLRQTQREFLSTAFLRAQVHNLTDGVDGPAAEGAEAQWLDQALQQFESLRRQHTHTALPGQWLNLFQQQLRCLDWPGPRRPDSNEFQQLTQWYQLLEEFARFDVSHGPVDLAAALDMLGQLAASTHFQAQTPESPIQILGMLEGAGLDFSHCWVLGMSASNWPPAAAPNPLLPLELQRRHAMPHADAKRELQFASALTRHFSYCAGTVIFSYAQLGDDSPQQLSPLIESIVDLHSRSKYESLENEWQQYLRSMCKFKDYEWLNIAQAPAVDADELQQLRGGSQIFRDQAVLPAAAFLLHRLLAERELRYYTGLNPMQRGQLLHQCLSRFWSRLEDREALLALDPDARQKQLQEIVADSLQRLAAREPRHLQQRLLTLEQQRMCKLLEDWLQLEMQRPPFRRIAVEQEFTVEFCGIPVRLIVDRVDLLEQGQYLLLDYKTGKVTTRDWGGSRPQDPQLPLYSVTYPEPVAGIAFAAISAREVKLAGVADRGVIIEGIVQPDAMEKQGLPADWSSTLQQWRDNLATLAQDFLTGDASLQLLSKKRLRNYQQLLPILRIQEAGEIESCQARRRGRS